MKAFAPSSVFTVYVKATPEQVWRALTEPEFTRHYFYETEAIVGDVVEADPPRRLVMTFDARWDERVAADPPSSISWEITDAGPGVVQLTVVHDGLLPASATLEQVTGGMPFILSALKTLLETGDALVAAT